MKHHKLILLLFIFVLSFVVGCLPTYVGNPDTAKIDPQFIGIWHAKKENDHQIWIVHKMNDHNYMTQGYFIKTGADGKNEIESSITARAWLADISGQKFVSMETYSTGLFTDPDEAGKNRYLVGNIVVANEGFTFKHVAPDFFKDKPITRPAELEKAIADHLNNKDLYLDPVTFKRLDPKNPGDQKNLLELIK